MSWRESRVWLGLAEQPPQPGCPEASGVVFSVLNLPEVFRTCGTRRGVKGGGPISRGLIRRTVPMLAHRTVWGTGRKTCLAAGRLRNRPALGLIDYPSAGRIVATKIVFPT